MRQIRAVFEKQVPKILGGNVRAVASDISRLIRPATHWRQTNVHPHACEAVKLVEGVRLLAGNEDFGRRTTLYFAIRSRSSEEAYAR